MKHISILVPKGAILGSVEGPRLLLSQVNNLLSSKGISPLFKIELIGLTKETPLSGGLFTAHSDHTIDEIRKTDLIIIPAIDGDLKNVGAAVLRRQRPGHDAGAAAAAILYFDKKAVRTLS